MRFAVGLGAAIIGTLLASCGSGGAVEAQANIPSTAAATSMAAQPTTSDPPSATSPQAPSTSAAAAAATSTTVTTSAPLPPILLGFAGDTAFTHDLHARDPLGDIAAELEKPDLMIVNLETTVAETDVGRAIQKRFTFKSPPVSGELLASAGVDVAALANNHALDYGPDAVLRTIEILQEAGVDTAGTGATPADAYRALRRNVKGWEVAILSFSRVPCDSPEPGETYIEEVAWACPQFEEATVAAVADAADADLTVVMIHWGVQRQQCPSTHQRELASAWIAAGADAIVGSHPHVLQGVEKIDGAWVIHSTGNFAFPSARNESSYSAIFLLEVAPARKSLAAFPVRILQGRPVPATDSREQILGNLTTRSFGYEFGVNGQAIATSESGSC